MDIEKIERLISKGEGIDIEFKECKMGLSKDVYETVCAFLNRIGGHIFLGVNNNGKVTGINPSDVADMKSSFATTSIIQIRFHLRFILILKNIKLTGK